MLCMREDRGYVGNLYTFLSTVLWNLKCSSKGKTRERERERERERGRERDFGKQNSETGKFCLLKLKGEATNQKEKIGNLLSLANPEI